MKSRRSYIIRSIIGVGFLCAYQYSFAAFAETCEKSVAKAVSVQGAVEVQKAGEAEWLPVKLNDTFCPGDKIRVEG